MDNFFDIPEKAEVTSVDKNGGRNDKKAIVQLYIIQIIKNI